MPYGLFDLILFFSRTSASLPCIEFQNLYNAHALVCYYICTSHAIGFTLYKVAVYTKTVHMRESADNTLIFPSVHREKTPMIRGFSQCTVLVHTI